MVIVVIVRFSVEILIHQFSRDEQWFLHAEELVRSDLPLCCEVLYAAQLAWDQSSSRRPAELAAAASWSDRGRASGPVFSFSSMVRGSSGPGTDRNSFSAAGQAMEPS